MKKNQQGAAVAVIAIGIVIVAISAGVLISELRKERAAREKLEQEAVHLKLQIEKLKAQSGKGSWVLTPLGSKATLSRW